MMRVILLFLCTNLSVMVLFGIVISLFGCICVNNTLMLMLISGIFGLGGALFSLLLSKSIALSAVNGVVVVRPSNDMESWLLTVIQKQSKLLNIVAPKLAIYNSLEMNAFATGYKKNSALVAVSTGLLSNMSRDSIEAVIAHEVNHIASGDMITMTLIQGIINTFVIFISRSLAQFVIYWMSYISERDENCGQCEYGGGDFQNITNHHDNINHSAAYMIISSILELLFGMIASIIVFWFSRNREFYADAGAARLVGCDKIIAALQELKYNCSVVIDNNVSSSNNEMLATLCIHNVANSQDQDTMLKGFLKQLFSSHPSLDKRIEALKNGWYLNKFSYF